MQHILTPQTNLSFVLEVRILLRTSGVSVVDSPCAAVAANFHLVWKQRIKSENLAGMISADVAQVLGAPTETRNLSPYVNTYGWYYRSLGIAVTFDANTVDRIILMRGSSASLDRSGLNCENTPYEFAQAYHLKSIPKIDYDDRYSSGGCYAIGGEEYLSFGSRMNHIMLSKYWN